MELGLYLSLTRFNSPATKSSASSQEIGSNCPLPRSPARFKGRVNRRGEFTTRSWDNPRIHAFKPGAACVIRSNFYYLIIGNPDFKKATCTAVIGASGGDYFFWLSWYVSSHYIGHYIKWFLKVNIFVFIVVFCLWVFAFSLIGCRRNHRDGISLIAFIDLDTLDRQICSNFGAEGYNHYS